MTRDIELQIILQTTQRRPRARAGEVILREGDPVVALFVVLAGHVDLRKTTPKGENVTLGTLGPGEIFGAETLANLPAGTTAVAKEDVTLLVLDPRTVLELMVRRPRFGLGLLQTICDRVAFLERLAAAGTVLAAPEPPSMPPASQRMAPPRSVYTPHAPRSATPTARTTHGSAPPRTPPRGTPMSAANDNSADPAASPAELPKEFWTKRITCPVCAAEFDALHLRTEAIRLKGRDSDFCEHYHGYNPLYYAIYVCPECFYAAYPDDFGRLSSKEAVAMGSALAEIIEGGEQYDFHGLRDHAAAVSSYRLALLCYRQREAEPRKLAGLYHRLAWLARTAGDSAQEKEHLAQAREVYRAALDQRPPLEGRAEAMAMYLLADISSRLGDAAEAMRWLEAAAKHPELDENLARTIQDLRQTLRERARA
jgi:uncharacterized protein (DUF2225 family)